MGRMPRADIPPCPYSLARRVLLHWAASQVTLLLEEVTGLCRELLLPLSLFPCPVPFVFFDRLS